MTLGTPSRSSTTLKAWVVVGGAVYGFNPLPRNYEEKIKKNYQS